MSDSIVYKRQANMNLERLARLDVESASSPARMEGRATIDKLPA